VIADSASRDLQAVRTTIAVNYNLEPWAVRNLYQTVGTNETITFKIIAPSIQEAVKAATAKFTAEELITERSAVAVDIKTNLVNKLWWLGILVTDINIVEFRFSPEFDAAIESKVRAEQDALAQKNLLEKVKYEAQQTIETARAQAESIRIQAEAVRSQGGADYVKLKWIEKWNGQLPTTTLGEQGFIVNLGN
jgi:prohibitin 2